MHELQEMNVANSMPTGRGQYHHRVLLDRSTRHHPNDPLPPSPPRFAESPSCISLSQRTYHQNSARDYAPTPGRARKTSRASDFSDGRPGTDGQPWEGVTLRHTGVAKPNRPLPSRQTESSFSRPPPFAARPLPPHPPPNPFPLQLGIFHRI